MDWTIERILRFSPERTPVDGYGHLTFHDTEGNRYLVNYDHNWVARLAEGGGYVWTAGLMPVAGSPAHTFVDLNRPAYLTGTPDEVLVSCTGSCRVIRLRPERQMYDLLIDGATLGIKDLGLCERAADGTLWANEITGCKLWQFNPQGNALQTLGGLPGYENEPVPFRQAHFNWIYDLRRGPDGGIYVLDSRNYAVRKVDTAANQVIPVAGTGQPGDAGDGGDPRQATFGSDPSAEFDGPWSLAVDEQGGIFVGDTYNHVVRYIDPERRTIRTIAGRREAVPGKPNDPALRDPLQLNLPRICSLEYHAGRLFIPEWDGELVILKRG